MDEKPKKAFYVLQFLERPYAFLDEFIYIPASDVIQINKKDYTVFTYPIEPGMKNKFYYDKWPYFLGKVKRTADTAQTARDICRDLNSRKLDDEETDLNGPEDNPADLEKNGKKRKAKTGRTKNEKKTKLRESGKSKDINIERALDDDDMLTPEFMQTLTKELESYEKQQEELDEAKKEIHKKSCLLKDFIDDLKSYNDEENTVDDKYQKLIEIINEKEKQIIELKLQLKEENGTKLANAKENSATRWTLRYPEETDHLFELLVDSGVYVNGVAKSYIVRAAKTRTDLCRMLLHEVFTDKALKTCDFNSLDEHAINILIQAVRFIQRPSGDDFDTVSKENILRSVKKRLYNLNKIEEFK
ncbi:uncharacterized protein LOC110997253 [Pieris rapae]|uniref:uncharacterized protein LOC110997253 n=1 Tax=Pieris rapae TaxID=64459 RepID=UPI001E27FA09|nr:uncharacterized protein LOC110997253 [Pieris rapae]